MAKLKLLISAYACAPNEGSEPGVGWNFVFGLSKVHEVHVISEQIKFEKPINEFLRLYPETNKNLKFYFIPKKRNKKLRKIWPPSYYWFYRAWQKKAYELALKINQKEDFHVIHQLTMVGYREPGYLWKIDKPFVWGPIGGLENSPWKFLSTLGIKGLIFYSGRNIVNIWQRNFNSRPKRAAMGRNNVLISATQDNSKFIKKLWKKDSYVIPEIGTNRKVGIVPVEREHRDPLRIIWSGLHIPRKNLSLLMKSLSHTNVPFELHILGKGPRTKKWKALAHKLDIAKNCIWYGWLDQNEALKIMSQAHVLCITSISDLTSTVTLEGLSLGLPIVCLDHCGFSHVVTASCGIKIPVDTPRNAALNFKEALENLYYDESFRQILSAGAIHRSIEFSWENKIEKLNSIYNNLLNDALYEEG